MCRSNWAKFHRHQRHHRPPARKRWRACHRHAQWVRLWRRRWHNLKRPPDQSLARLWHKATRTTCISRKAECGMRGHRMAPSRNFAIMFSIRPAYTACCTRVTWTLQGIFVQGMLKSALGQAIYPSRLSPSDEERPCCWPLIQANTMQIRGQSDRHIVREQPNRQHPALGSRSFRRHDTRQTGWITRSNPSRAQQHHARAIRSCVRVLHNAHHPRRRSHAPERIFGRPLRR